MSVSLATAGFLATLTLLSAWAGVQGVVDKTVVSQTKGRRAVDTVVGRVDTSCVFPDDKLFGRRFARVASGDGNNQNTFRNGYHGGIWQLDEDMFISTKTNTTVTSPLWIAIKRVFGIDWPTVRWSDLTKPLHCALAARLFIHSRGEEIPRDVDRQAEFYVRHCKGGNRAEDFKSRSRELREESDCKDSNGADIVFVLDGSGSIGASNFQLILGFVKSAIDAFDVGPGAQQTRVAIIQFATDVFHECNLTAFTNKTELKEFVGRIPYRQGSTNTHLALDALRNVSFGPNSGARPLENGHPRVGIVVTDGESNNAQLTIEAAKRVHDADITVISVGVGAAKDTELRVIASDPVCLHVIMLTNFNEFDSLNAIIEKRTCDAPIIISPDEDRESELAPGKDQNCKLKIPIGGITIKLITITGSATFYTSSEIFPSEFFYDQVVSSSPGRNGTISIKYSVSTRPSLLAGGGNSSEPEGIVYANIQGDEKQTTRVRLEAVEGGAVALQSSALLGLIAVAFASLLLSPKG
jgi:uncharacterized protein YegL